MGTGDGSRDKHLEALIEKLLKRLSAFSRRMEDMQIAEYVRLLNDPWRYMWLNFLGGIARGLGVALGATLLAALLIYFMQRLVVLNLPVIGDFIAELVRIVQTQL